MRRPFRPWRYPLCVVLLVAPGVLLGAEDRRERLGTYSLEAAQHLERGMALAKQQEYQEALSALDRALKADPNLQLAHYWRASVYADTGRTEEAIAVYKELVEAAERTSCVSSVTVDACINLGLTYAGDLNDSGNALAWFPKAILLDPTDRYELQWKAYRNMAIGLHNQGDHASAAVSAQLAYRANPQQVEQQMIADLLRRVGNDEVGRLLHLGEQSPEVSRRSVADGIKPVSLTGSVEEPIAELMLDPAANRIVALGEKARHFYVIDCSDKPVVRKVGTPGIVHAGSLAGGQLFLSLEEPTSICWVDIDTGEVLRSWEISGPAPDSLAAVLAERMAFFPIRGVLHSLDFDTGEVKNTRFGCTVVATDPLQRFCYSFVRKERPPIVNPQPAPPMPTPFMPMPPLPEPPAPGPSVSGLFVPRPSVPGPFMPRSEWMQTGLYKYVVTAKHLLLVGFRLNAASNGRRLHVSPDGHWAMIAGGGGWRPVDPQQKAGYGVAVFSAHEFGHLQAFFETGAYPQGVAVNPVTWQITVVREQDGYVYHLSDPQHGVPIKGPFGQPNRGAAATWSSDGRYLFVAAKQGGILAFETTLHPEEQKLAKTWWQDRLEAVARMDSAELRQGHIDLALTLNDLGVLLAGQGKYARATECHKEALDMRQQLFPEEQYPQGSRHLAQSLDNLGDLLMVQGQYGEACKYLQQALDMYSRLYPEDQYPQGHPSLATALNNLGASLETRGEYDEARKCYQQALAMLRRLSPDDQYPQGHPSLATTLNNVGVLLRLQGEYGEARRYYQQALHMQNLLYPEKQYPEGHPDLAITLDNLGLLLQSQGDYGEARRYLKQALDMRSLLYPEDQYPQGHPDLATTLHNLGLLLQSQGEYGEAREYCQRALDMDSLLYPEDQYPQGHPDLAASLSNLGALLEAQGEYGEAREYYQHALDMCSLLYPEDQYPQGHPHLAYTLNNLGVLLQSQGDYGEARRYLKQALDMRSLLYPEDQYPQGHPDLAASLSNLGALLEAQGEYGEARKYLKQALSMSQDLADAFFGMASEVEALSFVAQRPLFRDGLLSVSQELDEPTDDLYGLVWRDRGVIGRVIARRQEMLTAVHNPEALQRFQTYLETRRVLARLTLAPAEADPRRVAGRRKRLLELAKQKEHLERELAAQVPEFRRQLELQRTKHADLAKNLPPRAVFVDLLRYTLFAQDPDLPGREGQSRTASYVAFLVQPGRPVVRVELGPAAPIDVAVARWRDDIVTGRSSSAADDLRRLVWEPLEGKLTAETKTVILCPDGALTALPWAALPGRKKDKKHSVLLEEYAFAVVPHGQFLLEQLTSEPTIDDDQQLLLAVGDVSYDDKPTAVAEPVLSASRAALRGDGQLYWSVLPGTKGELDELLTAAGKRDVSKLTGDEASTGRVLAELPEARWAHLATHAFFADPKFRSALQLDEKAFEQRQFLAGERTTVAGRNPLVLSGLVLAGANLPAETDQFGIPQGDGGILTAEAIAGLPLQNLELAVLSACETGLGEVAGGEGVFGLQRAFHIAGAHTTVASLWKVDDEATRRLMTAFYHNMWQKGMGKLEALRQAQLSMLNAAGASATGRAPREEDRERSEVPPDQRAEDRGPAPGGKDRPRDVVRVQRTDPRLWAAWVLSGDPGPLTFTHQPAQPPDTAVVQSDAAAEHGADSVTESSVAKRISVYFMASLLIVVLVIGAVWYRRRRSAA